MLSALAVSDLSALTVIAWLIAELAVISPAIIVEPVPETVWAKVPSLRVNVPWLDTTPPMLSALAVSDLSALTAIAWLINELAVISPAIIVEPVPETVWDRVPSLRVNVPWLDTAPPMLSALAVSDLSALTVIAWLIAEFAITTPSITVEPLPLTVWANVPPFKFNVPSLSTAPPMLPALAVSDLSVLTVIAWAIAEFATTSPLITVVPSVPPIAEVRVPSPKVIVPELEIVSVIFKLPALIAKLEPLLILSAFWVIAFATTVALVVVVPIVVVPFGVAASVIALKISILPSLRFKVAVLYISLFAVSVASANVILWPFLALMLTKPS